MAWYDDVLAGTTQTSTGSIGFGLQIYYDKSFLRTVQDSLRLVRFGQKRSIPEGGGKQIRFFRYNQPAVSTTALTEGVNPAATAITGQEINATIADYGHFSAHSSLVSRTHIDRKLAGVTKIWGNDAASTLDLLTWTELANGGIWPVHCNCSGATSLVSYTYEGQIATSTTNASITLILSGTSAATGLSNDWWNGGLCCVYKGTGYGQTRVITDYAAGATTANSVVTISGGFETALDSTSWVRMVRTAGVTTGMIPTYDIMMEQQAQMVENKGTPISNGYFVFLAHPKVIKDLKSDSTWIPLAQYEGNAGGIISGEMGRFCGMRVVESTQGYRHTAGTVQTYVETAAVRLSLILAQEAFGVVTIGGDNPASPSIIIKNPGPGDTSNPLNRFSTVGWTIPFTAKALNSNWAIGLFSYHV
ncbi:MAG: N4-gp56 family major capsid protein [Candidatus Micrarchaeia archaeon]|jgi:N4-gp56 family major capsid protein